MVMIKLMEEYKTESSVGCYGWSRKIQTFSWSSLGVFEHGTLWQLEARCHYDIRKISSAVILMGSWISPWSRDWSLRHRIRYTGNRKDVMQFIILSNLHFPLATHTGTWSLYLDHRQIWLSKQPLDQSLENKHHVQADFCCWFKSLVQVFFVFPPSLLMG